MRPEEAINEARSGKLRPVYLVLGEEAHLAQQVVSEIRAQVEKAGVPGLNTELMVAGETTVQAVLAKARTLPMMAKQRVLVIKQVERWQTEGKSEGTLDALAAYAEAPVDSTVLVLWASGLDKRKRLVQRAQKQGFLVACDTLSTEDLTRWISARAKAEGQNMGRRAAELLAELAGPELSAVADAFERVSLFVGPQKEITSEAVAECVTRLRETSVWALVDAVGRRDIGAALGALSEVYDPADRGLPLVSLLAWSARQLLRFQAATLSGSSPEEAAKRAGAPAFKARALAQQASRLSRHELEAWLLTLAKIDLDLKGQSRRPPQAILEHALIELCRAKSASAAQPFR